MNEAMRLEIVQRRQSGMSQRGIADELGISRCARAAAGEVQARDGQATPARRPRPRKSIIDPYEPILQELLAKYPNITTERAVQELRRAASPASTRSCIDACVCCGHALRRRVCRALRPNQASRHKWAMASMTSTSHAKAGDACTSSATCSAIPRRQYLHFVESMDLPTTVREHVHAFHHLGGVARVCLYDNFKAVVLCHDADGAFYNPKFLAFATHYGFRPQACRVRRPQTKGKVERHFAYVESNLLNGRTFETLEHLNEVTAWWLQSVADVRVLRDFKESPFQRHQLRVTGTSCRCQAATSTPPRSSIAMSGVDGYITHRSNHVFRPLLAHPGQVLPVRVTETEVLIYSIGFGRSRTPCARAPHPDRRAAIVQSPSSGG